jgi:ABC-type polar amino acid transport system ATPase subunit
MNLLERSQPVAPTAESASGQAPVVVDIRGLVKSFDGRVVLDNIDLTIRQREIVGIIGSSGGGKTTLLRCINLLERPDRGHIDLLGKPIFEGTRMVCPSLTQLRQSVGMVFQRFHLFPHLTAIENVMLAQMKAAHASEEEALTTAVRLLKRVRLGHRGLAFPDQMSGGEQQRVAIARALALQPTVLLFDEPTSSLDPEATGEVLQVMRELAADGITMALVTHEIAFAREVADHVVFVAGGRIVEEGPPSEVIDRPQHERTKGFLMSYLSGRGLAV